MTLPATISDLNTAKRNDLLSFFGQSDGFQRSGLTQLKINRASDNDDGLLLTPGTFKLFDQASGMQIYGKTIWFRPFIATYKYDQFDQNAEEYVCSTIHFKSWSDSAIDTTGGERCGKVAGKHASKLSATQMVTQKQIRCSRHLFGTVTMTGKPGRSLDGPVPDDVTITDLPVVWKNSGASFMPVSDAITALTKRGLFLFEANLKFGLTREQKGSNIFYVPTLMDQATATKMPNDLDTINLFQEEIDSINSDVFEKWQEARRQTGKQKETIDEAKVIDSLDADFSDDLNTPILMP